MRLLAAFDAACRREGRTAALDRFSRAELKQIAAELKQSIAANEAQQRRLKCRLASATHLRSRRVLVRLPIFPWRSSCRKRPPGSRRARRSAGRRKAADSVHRAENSCAARGRNLAAHVFGLSHKAERVDDTHKIGMVPLWCNNIVVALPLCDMPGVDRRTTPAEAVGFGGNPAPRRVKIRSVRPYRNAAGTIRAFLSAESPSGMIINGLRLMIGSRGSPWIAMPDIKRREEISQAEEARKRCQPQP